jgi:hypothetical protein
MVQPKYSPQEALEKMKLMMKYDSSKTLTENREPVRILNEIAPLIYWGIAAVAAALGIGGGIWGEHSSADSETKIKKTLQACDNTDPEAIKINGRTTMGPTTIQKVVNKFKESFSWTLFGLGIGGGTDLEALNEALKMLENKGSFGDVCAVRKRYNEEGGKTLEEDLISELNTQDLTKVSNAIALTLSKTQKGNVQVKQQETANTQWWLDAFPCLEVTDSFAQNFTVNPDRYGNTWVDVNFKVKGQVKPFHLLWNGRIYTADTHKYTGKKVECSGTKVTLVSESVISKKKIFKEQADLGNVDLIDISSSVTPDPNTNTTPECKYKICSETLPIKMCCKNSTISKVQECLGFTGSDLDGKFGPITSKALVAKGADGQSITQTSIDKVCGEATPEKLTKDIEVTDLSGDSSDLNDDKIDNTNSEEGMG